MARARSVGSSSCSSGQCTYRIDDKLWSAVGHSSQDQEVKMTVAGSTGRGVPIGTSSPAVIRFAPDDIKGGLYYFSPTIKGIKRVPIGASKPVDFITNGDETGCAGCHAVSRDGKKVAVEFGSGQTGTGSTVVDGINPKMRAFPLNRSIAWNFAWFNSTGDKFIANWSGSLKVRDSSTGAVLETVQPSQIGGLGLGAMPEWSPDNKWLAFVRYTRSSPYDFELVDSGDIVVMPYNGGSFGPATTVISAKIGSEVHFWPSWSPDSKWLVFNSYTCGGNCNSYNARTTRLRRGKGVMPTAQDPVVFEADPWEALQQLLEAENLGRSPDFLVHQRLRRLRKRQRKGHVVVDGLLRIERIVLEHHRHRYRGIHRVYQPGNQPVYLVRGPVGPVRHRHLNLRKPV